MVNRIFFEGRDAGAVPHLWAEAFADSSEPLAFQSPAGLSDAGLWIVRDRPAVQTLTDGAAVAFVPEYYEMNYAYPLIVWLADADETPDQFERRMTGISPRNCLGLQLPVDPATGTRRVLEAIRDGVAELREAWHVHTERIIPAGAERFGEAALQAFLAKPEWFGGAIAVDAAFSQPPVLPLRNAELRDKRVLLGTSKDADPQQSLKRLLSAAGLAVTELSDVDDGASVLADINAWLMEGICIAV